MHHVSLARVFRRIVLLSLPGSAIAVGTACSGTVHDSSSTDAPGAGGSTTESGGSMNALTGGATNAMGGATNAMGGGAGGTTAGGGMAGYGGPDSYGLAFGGGVTFDGGAAFNSCGDRLPAPNEFPPCSAFARCISLEGIKLPPSDASMPVYSRTECTPLCGSSGWISCAPVIVHGARMLKCNQDCTGRRPPGLVPSLAIVGPVLGAYFAEMAQLEAASIDAFRLLRDELAHHRAPRALVRAAERAIRDEVRHTRLTLALARRHGGDFRLPVVEKMPLRTLEAIAVDNAVEGCVRETFGALVATYQSRAAMDPSIRGVMKRIARDETRHAALAHDIDGWIRGRLDRAARARVEAARLAATETLLAREDQLGFGERRALGLPTQSEARELLQAMTVAIAA
jgi:hypothetical protein